MGTAYGAQSLLTCSGFFWLAVAGVSGGSASSMSSISAASDKEYKQHKRKHTHALLQRELAGWLHIYSPTTLSHNAPLSGLHGLLGPAFELKHGRSNDVRRMCDVYMLVYVYIVCV